jgi:S-adenosylmethionine decarboxylase proenzyme
VAGGSVLVFKKELSMRGLHLTADIAGCRMNRGLMTDATKLRSTCLMLVELSGLTAVSEVFFEFPAADGADSGGVTGTVLLAESHLAIHTWPELGAVTLDVYVCNYSMDNGHKAQRLIDGMVDLFKPDSLVRQQLERGEIRASVLAA